MKYVVMVVVRCGEAVRTIAQSGVIYPAATAADMVDQMLSELDLLHGAKVEVTIEEDKR